MNKIKYALLASIGFTYSLILIGGFVRVSGAGMGCPDWPKCFDRWYPPLNVSQIPDYIDPSLFNVNLAWIEYFNRLFGMITGIVIFSTFLLFIKIRKTHSLGFYLILTAVLLTGLEGWIGGQVVATHLEPIVITIHLLLALIIIASLIMSYCIVFKKNNNDNFRYNNIQTKIVKWILICTIIEIILGTQIRESLENLISLQMIGSFKYIHTFLGLGLLLLMGMLWNKINEKEFPRPHIKNRIKILLNIFIVQIIFGELMVFGGLPIYARLIHMWLPSISLGIIIYILMDMHLSNNIKLEQ